jgi:PepSY-associated TM region
MAKPNQINNTMRVYHRYLGFFLAGIMAVYAISGIYLIFRETGFLQTEQKFEKTLPANVDIKELGKILEIPKFKAGKEENGIIPFRGGTYDTKTHIAKYTTKKVPKFLEKMILLHLSSTEDPMYLLNTFFGVALLFFVVSAFFMYMPGTTILKKGLWFSLAGLIMTLLMLYFW